jgi:hypothetical protein
LSKPSAQLVDPRRLTDRTRRQAIDVLAREASGVVENVIARIDFPTVSPVHFVCVTPQRAETSSVVSVTFEAADASIGIRPMHTDHGDLRAAGGLALQPQTGELDHAFLHWFESRLADSGPEPREEDVLDYLVALALRAGS